MVGTSRRRAASEALSSSDGIGPSLIKAEFTTQPLDLFLDLGQNGQVVGADEDVPGIFQRRQQLQRLLERQCDLTGRPPVGSSSTGPPRPRLSNGGDESRLRL